MLEDRRTTASSNEAECVSLLDCVLKLHNLRRVSMELDMKQEATKVF